MNILRFNKSSILGSLVLAGALAAGGVTADEDNHGGADLVDALDLHGSTARSVEKAVDLHDHMRKLMEDHIVWTRSVIVSVAADLPNLGVEAARLQANQDDIGALFGEYYGDDFGEDLANLLHDHISIAAALLFAVRDGDPSAATLLDDWYQNGDDIAVHLNRVNRRHWKLAETKEMMKSHLDTTLTEAAARLTGDMDGDIAAYDEVHHHMLHMADFLSNGIIKQFPHKFRGHHHHH